MTYLLFALDVEDDWPPVSAEGMECPAQGGGFRIEIPPLFIKGLSVGDVIKPEFDDQGRVVEWAHISKSRRSTVWLLELEDNTIEPVLACLRRLDCTIVKFEAYRHYAVDVPEECDASDVDACLELADAASVPRAFPSFRHDDEQ
jgi:hypothetical protein